MKQRMMFLCTVVLLLISIAACSEKDNKPTDVNIEGYQLSQFISQNTIRDYIDPTAADSIDYRNLFAYEIIASDGFSPRNSSFAGYDINWDTFKLGYLVPSDNFRTWFENPSLPGAFRVRNTTKVNLYRKIDVMSNNTLLSMMELKGLEVHQVANWDSEMEEAIKLSDLLLTYAPYDSCMIVCHDGYGTGKYYQPEAIHDGYYLLDSERTIFPTASIPNNMKKMKQVLYIEVFGANGGGETEMVLAPRENADLEIVLPTDLTPFTPTVLSGYGG